jgi:hypothetical protein
MQSLELFESLSSTPARMRLAAGACIRVSAGKLWLTVEGQSDDVWLSAGAQWCASRDLMVWLSGEPTAKFDVLYPVSRKEAENFGASKLEQFTAKFAC